MMNNTIMETIENYILKTAINIMNAVDEGNLKWGEKLVAEATGYLMALRQTNIITDDMHEACMRYITDHQYTMESVEEMAFLIY